ncbi:unnamed protein product [Alternaria burnsii]|nr:unnamed protein product [Alternaria burnsii]
MSSQDTIPDNTLYQEYRDNSVHQSSVPEGPTITDKSFSGKKEIDQLDESASCKTKEAVPRKAARQSEQHDAGIKRLWDELKDLREQKKRLSIQEDIVLSRLYEAVGYMGKTSQSSPPKSRKTLRWANSVDDRDSDEDIRRSNKRARNSS